MLSSDACSENSTGPSGHSLTVEETKQRHKKGIRNPKAKEIKKIGTTKKY